jgi:hypothetical protein
MGAPLPVYPEGPGGGAMAPLGAFYPLVPAPIERAVSYLRG